MVSLVFSSSGSVGVEFDLFVDETIDVFIGRFVDIFVELVLQSSEFDVFGELLVSNLAFL